MTLYKRTLVISLGLVLVACHSGPPGSTGRPDSGVDGGGGGPGDSAGPRPDLLLPIPPATPSPTICTPPISLADISHPTSTVGSGPGSCTEALLRSAVTAGGVIVFDCGGPATITITTELTLPIDRDTVIDGGGTVTIDGGATTRIFHFTSGDYLGKYGGPQHLVTLQNLRLAHGHGSGTKMFPAANPPCSQGYQDGQGGAILMTSGSLHILNCTFVDNQAAQIGPDVGGGAVYSSGSSDTTIVGSTFSGNSASNAGAVGALNSELALTNDSFDNNQATGQGANSTNGSCPVVGGQREIGNGGNGGAVAIDGGDNHTINVCGCSFTNNSGHAFGGALFRTPDGPQQATNFNLCTFDHNTCSGSYNGKPTGGGGALYLHNSAVQINASTFSNNSAPGAGAIFADSTQIALTNSTLYANIATTGVGGAIANTEGTITNCTFADNEAHGTNYAAFAAALFGGPWTINNSIFSGNIDNDNSGNEACANGTNSGADNVQWPHGGTDSACAPGIDFTDALLGPLANHGGTTMTLLPAAAAAVVQVGANCPATDQAGHARAKPCTLGALEITP